MSTHDIERLNDDDKKVIGNTTSTTQPSRLRTNRSMLYICIKKDQRDKLSSEVNGLIYLFVIKVLTGRWANSNFDGLAMWIDKFEFRHKSTNLRRRRESQKCSKKELFFIDSTLSEEKCRCQVTNFFKVAQVDSNLKNWRDRSSRLLVIYFFIC